MTTKENKEHRRPMNVYVRRGSNDRVSEADGNLTEVFREVELTDNIGTVPVQFMYSNAVHGPEGPIATRVHRSILFREVWDLPGLLLAF